LVAIAKRLLDVPQTATSQQTINKLAAAGIF
jgi:hypothetical protein